MGYFGAGEDQTTPGAQFEAFRPIRKLAKGGPSVAETYPALDRVTGAGFSGVPPVETGPGLSGGRDVCLRDVLTKRARAFGGVMEDVVSGVTAVCMESTRAISEES